MRCGGEYQILSSTIFFYGLLLRLLVFYITQLATNDLSFFRSRSHIERDGLPIFHFSYILIIASIHAA